MAPKKRTDLSTRDEILEAASTLFATQGFIDTTTRQIAERVGIKQASLYYHFTDKNSILTALLTTTVEPSVRFAEWLVDQKIEPATRLYALARFDLAVILRDRWNLHVIFRLPDVADKDRPDSLQKELRQHYRRFAEDAAATGSGPAAVRADIDLIFGLVESILVQRSWGNAADRRAYADSIARGCLRLALLDEATIERADVASRAVIAEYEESSA